MDIFDGPGDPNGITWADFQRDLQAAGRSPRTIQSYGEAMAQLAAHCKGADLLELGKGDIQGYLIWARTHHSAATEQVRYRSLHRFYRWAEKQEWIAVSPMARMSLPSAPRKIIDVPERDDLTKLLAACAGDDFDSLRDTAIILLMAGTGLRLAECASLTAGRVDLRQNLVRITGKGAKERQVRFEQRTSRALSRYLRARLRHPLARLDALWLGARGVALTPNGVAQMLRRRCKKAEIAALHPHQLRHYWASEVFRQGMSDQDAMQLAGWSSHAMPLVYGAATRASRALTHRLDVKIEGAL